MRLALLSLALVAVSAIPAAAHADTFFDLTTSSGSSFTFSFHSGSFADASQFNFTSGINFQMITTDAAGYTAMPVFENPTFFSNHFYNEPLNLEFVAHVATGDGLVAFMFDGAQLYSGSESSPVFTDGTYQLAESANCQCGTATLVISDSALPPLNRAPLTSNPLPTPEPSSALLLGTGVTAFSVLRRRLR